MASRGRQGRFRRNGFDNPSVAEGVKEIDQDWERDICRKLSSFSMDKNSPKLVIPSLQRHERRRLHELARRHGLNSTSSGKEPNRVTTVFHRVKRPLKLDADVKNAYLTNEMKDDVMTMIKKFPINEDDVKKHLHFARAGETGRSRTVANFDNMQPPPLSQSPFKKQRMKLPAFEKRADILKAVDKYRVLLISGGTGCGKTTQVPQYLLEDAAESHTNIRIMCTQPRRLPAIAVADRVSKERGEHPGSVVGYHIRLEKNVNSNASLVYCTSGVLLRMLSSSDSIKNVSHVILDEVHEREQNTDYLLIALKEALRVRQDLKVILMSATMEANLDLFTRYFEREGFDVGRVHINSTLYPVEVFHLGELIAMTGYMPTDSMFIESADAFSSSSFPNVSNWNGNDVVQHRVKQDWDDYSTPATGFSIPEAQTTPNLAAMGASGAGPVHSASMTSLTHLQTPQQQNSNLFSVAQQLVSSHSITSTAAPFPKGGYPQMNQPGFHGGYNPQIRPTEAVGGVPSHRFNQRVAPTGTYTVPDHQQQANGNIPHSSTWGTGMEVGAGPASGFTSDVVDLPVDNVDPELMDQFREMHSSFQVPPAKGFQAEYANNGGYMQQEQTWQHTQSYPANMSQMGVATVPLHTWEGPQQQPQPGGGPPPAQYMQNGARFYVPQDSFDSSGNTEMTYFNQPMNGSVGFPNPASHRVDDAVSQFRFRMQESESQRYTMRSVVTNCYPDRPASFDRTVPVNMHHRGFNFDMLTNIYYKCGGDQYREGVDMDLCFSLIKFLMDSTIKGAILVFLPGYDDIQSAADMVNREQWKGTRPVVFTLHSQLNTLDQQKVFDSVGDGYRKVILSTNIAEASLTIDDVVFVIDSGKVKEKSYDHESRISELKLITIAKSNADQRKGRAGRCQPGFCFRLFDSNDYLTMQLTQTPEIQRSAIHEVVLHAKMFAPNKMTVREFLSAAPEPPPAIAVDHSMLFLEELGAVYNEAATSDLDVVASKAEGLEPALTDLGKYMALLPLDPQLSRMLLFGLVLKCLSPIVTIVAALSNKDPFIIVGKEERTAANAMRDKFARNDFSDHLTNLRVILDAQMRPNSEVGMFCRTHYVSQTVVKHICGVRKQLLHELSRAGLINMSTNPDIEPEYNMYADCWPMVRAAIVAGSYPSYAVTRNNNAMRRLRTRAEKEAELWKASSVKRQVMGRSNQDPKVEFYVFHELVFNDHNLAIRTATVVPPVAFTVFTGAIRLKQSIIEEFNIRDNDYEAAVDAAPEDADNPWAVQSEATLEIGEKLVIRGKPSDMQCLVQLRFKVMDYFLRALKNPDLIRYPKQFDSNLLSVLSKVLTEEHREMGFDNVQGLIGHRDLSSIKKMMLDRKNRAEMEAKEAAAFAAAERKIALEKRDDKPSNIKTARQEAQKSPCTEHVLKSTAVAHPTGTTSTTTTESQGRTSFRDQRELTERSEQKPSFSRNRDWNGSRRDQKSMRNDRAGRGEGVSSAENENGRWYDNHRRKETQHAQEATCSETKPRRGNTIPDAIASILLKIEEKQGDSRGPRSNGRIRDEHRDDRSDRGGRGNRTGTRGSSRNYENGRGGRDRGYNRQGVQKYNGENRGRNSFHERRSPYSRSDNDGRRNGRRDDDKQVNRLSDYDDRHFNDHRNDYRDNGEERRDEFTWQQEQMQRDMYHHHKRYDYGNRHGGYGGGSCNNARDNQFHRHHEEVPEDPDPRNEEEDWNTFSSPVYDCQNYEYGRKPDRSQQKPGGYGHGGGAGNYNKRYGNSDGYDSRQRGKGNGNSRDRDNVGDKEFGPKRVYVNSNLIGNRGRGFK